MAVSSTRRLVVRVEGVSHEIARAELVGVRLLGRVVSPESIDSNGVTVRVVLLCSMDSDPLYIHPRTVVNVPDGAGIDCMTCLVRKARS